MDEGPEVDGRAVAKADADVVDLTRQAGPGAVDLGHGVLRGGGRTDHLTVNAMPSRVLPS